MKIIESGVALPISEHTAEVLDGLASAWINS